MLNESGRLVLCLGHVGARASRVFGSLMRERNRLAGLGEILVVRVSGEARCGKETKRALVVRICPGAYVSQSVVLI